MRTERVDELLLARYLLGNLTEEEQVRVEDRAFADRDYMGALNAAEADLIDDYVSGELAQADRRAFESRFLTSPQRRSKVEFAQALARVTAEAEPVASRVPQRPTTWLGLLNPIRAWNPAMRFAGALGAVICVAGGSWLVIENASMRSRVSALEAQRRDLEVRAQGLKQELGQAQTRAEGLAAQVRNTPTAEGAHTPLVASLMLMPGLSRAESRVEQLTLGRRGSGRSYRDSAGGEGRLPALPRRTPHPKRPGHTGAERSPSPPRHYWKLGFDGCSGQRVGKRRVRVGAQRTSRWPNC